MTDFPYLSPAAKSSTNQNFSLITTKGQEKVINHPGIIGGDNAAGFYEANKRLHRKFFCPSFNARASKSVSLELLRGSRLIADAKYV